MNTTAHHQADQSSQRLGVSPSSSIAIRALFRAKGRIYVEIDHSIVNFLGIDEGQLVQQSMGRNGIMLKLLDTEGQEQGATEE